MPDFQALAGFDQGLYLILLLLTLLPALRIGSLVFRPTGYATAKSARWNLLWIGAALLVALAQWGTTCMLYESFGWMYIKDKLLGFLPLIFLPAVVTAFVTVPRLWRLATHGQIVTPFAITPDNTRTSGEMEKIRRQKATAPEMIVPVYTFALGAILAAILQFFIPAVTLQWDLLLIFWGCLIAGSSAFWIWQSWQQQRFGHSGTLTRSGFVIRFLRGVFVLLLLSGGSLTWFSQAMHASRLPDQMSMAPVHGQHSPAFSGPSVSVTELTGPRTGVPDRQFTLTAQKTMRKLPSGKTIEAWTYNGQYPGPELRMKQGELVEVVLKNKDIDAGVTLHWHGLNVPNAEDGVAGATQDAVLPGETHVYRFVAEQTGTYWYHSHQQSAVQVKKGLLGALIIEPATTPNPAPSPQLDLALVHHKLGSGERITLSGITGRTTKTAAPGTSVRLRLINADSFPATFRLQGASFQVAAIDGNDVHEPNLIANQQLLLAAGGRYDVIFTMPDHPVFLSPSKTDNDNGLLLSPHGSGDAPAPLPDLPYFDPASYGSPLPLPFTLQTTYDRDFQLVFDVQFGFYNGRLDGLWTINGRVFPNTPMLHVKEGDLVKMTFVNRSFMDHPMHLHGHHMLVLSQNGKPTTGSPWWADTLNVAPGETYIVAFRADNPGLWMDHCHNLSHAALGMSMHLVYEGISSPFLIGSQTRNQPE
ncbi:multicopper oxidase family protein [Brevibacillus centrosporus]|uniref:multicopper oxidase family protein n=1 Tax=Brevibacillus centrosporus TaxID=54910 RepID=UPI003B02D36E